MRQLFAPYRYACAFIMATLTAVLKISMHLFFFGPSMAAVLETDLFCSSHGLFSLSSSHLIRLNRELKRHLLLFVIR